MIPDEEEVLILPFSVFKVTNRIENSSDTSSSMLVEIYLEECQQNQKCRISLGLIRVFSRPIRLQRGLEGTMGEPR